MKTRSPATVLGLLFLFSVLTFLPSCQPPENTQTHSAPTVQLQEAQSLQSWPAKPMRIGLVFSQPIGLRELEVRAPGDIEGVLFSIGSLQGAFRSHEAVSAQEAAARVRDYARFYLTRQKEIDLQQIQRLLDQYEVQDYTEREARRLFKQSRQAQAYARTLIERSINRHYAQAVLEGRATPVYALEVFADPRLVWSTWGGRLEGVARYTPNQRFYPAKPPSTLSTIAGVRDRANMSDLDRIFDEAVRILRDEYGIESLFAVEVQP